MNNDLKLKMLAGFVTGSILCTTGYVINKYNDNTDKVISEDYKIVEEVSNNEYLILYKNKDYGWITYNNKEFDSVESAKEYRDNLIREKNNSLDTSNNSSSITYMTIGGSLMVTTGVLSLKNIKVKKLVKKEKSI